MLDTATKRRIDSARDILVGKVPDPKSQVEQITIALIYKFMDDMDADSEELGGQRKFFTGDYARYGWARLMRSGLGGHETLNLYAEGIAKMPENAGIPPLFRDIFKNAYLPYRDPETLKSFLKIIDEFAYDHSERLGDAFEYLLSVLGSQGDAGQFRTPRHIIDFMVEVLDPQKTDTVLDPACGTAGFLISSWKHILKANTDASGHSTLTPDERARLARNFKGYDISPDMVRLSLVNLYLHGFSDPHIVEYDTLTSDERWHEHADVILANPPFMSPKGGIKPHKRFSIQAKRSEVLFVDYMAEHLTPNGRAGIIVPEGIIFQSQTAYTQLRKLLVEQYLVAVVSLPAGVFQPYSGVKTSILILDKSLAKQSDSIAFFKVDNDGYGLGAQRRAIDKNDLPAAAAALQAFRHSRAEAFRHSRAGTSSPSGCVGDGNPADFDASAYPGLLVVDKARIAANGDYNLSGERYREGAANNHSFPLISIGDGSIFRVESGGTPKSDVEEYWGGGISWATLVDLPALNFITEITSTQRTISEKGLRESSAKMIPANSVIVSTRATIGRIAINRIPIATNQGFKNVVIEDAARAVPEFVALALTKLVPTMQAWATGGTFAEISKSKFCELQIPLPPLEVQKEIVAEIAGYQKVIDGARAVLDHYRPHIPIHPDWPMVELGKACEAIMDGTHFSPSNTETGERPYITSKNVRENYLDLSNISYISEEDHRSIYSRCPVRIGDVLYIKDGANTGLAAINTLTEEFSLLSSVAVMRGKPEILNNRYLAFYLNSDRGRQSMLSLISGVAITRLTLTKLNSALIPLPPLATQQAIVAEIEAEQALVAANRELIARFEQKIQATLARVWGEDESIPAEA
ncbi:MAG: N-6 DNA methylase [Vulcanimicrobiaceae bacterium]